MVIAAEVAMEADNRAMPLGDHDWSLCKETVAAPG